MKRILSLVLVLVLPVFAAAQGRVVEEIVVRVNDQILTRSDYLSRKQATIEGWRQVLHGQELSKQLADVDKNLLSIMVDEMLLIEKAKQAYDVERIVEYQVQQFMKENNLASEEEFHRALAQQGMNESQFRRQIRQVMVPEFMKSREVRQKIAITDEEIQAFYEEKRDSMHMPEGVSLREIVFLKDQTFESVALERAAEVRRRVAAGEDFAKLAEEFSQSYSRVNGGDIGSYAKGELSADTEKAVFVLQPGQLSELVATESGWYLFQVTARTAAQTLSVEDARPRIVNFLQESRFRDALEAYVAELRKTNTIWINPKYQS